MKKSIKWISLSALVTSVAIFAGPSSFAGQEYTSYHEDHSESVYDARPDLQKRPTIRKQPVSDQRSPVITSARLTAAPPQKIALRLLIVSATAQDPALAGAKSLLDQLGVPYEVLIATTSDLVRQQLVAPDGSGRYQGIMLTTGNLVYFDGLSWQSAFTDAEWNLLWQYERDYRVRQVALYASPGTYPEDYGLVAAGTADTSLSPLLVSLSQGGQAVFPYLQPQAQIPVRNAWAYLAHITLQSGAEALLNDAAGNVLAVKSLSVDGRERIALTFDQSPYLLHTQLLGYGLVRWVTQGLFLGERRMRLAVDVDDWFLASDHWDPAIGAIGINPFRLSARDALSMAQQQSALRSRYPLAKEFTFSMAFNGTRANLGAARSCDPNVSSVDPLTSVTHCLRDSFRWVNHTFTHQALDFTDYTTTYQEIQSNSQLAAALDLRFSKASLVTGNMSGLGYYGSNGAAPVDYGLLASNRNLLQAARDLGVRYMAADRSVPGQTPSCPGCGIRHPLASDILLVPRWPTNVFYYVTTPDEATGAYNAMYGPGGSRAFWDHNLSYAEYLDVDTDIALSHVLSFSPYPHYFHQGNMREYAANRSLLHDWLDQLLAKYTSYYNLPLQNLSWIRLGEYVADRTSHMNSQAIAVWDRAAGTLTVAAPKGGVVFITGAQTGYYTVYGGDPISRVRLAPNGSTVINLMARDGDENEDGYRIGTNYP